MQMRKIGFIMNINPLHPSKQVTTPVQCICGLDSLLSRTRRTISQHHDGGYLSTAVNNSTHIQDRRDLPPFLLSLAGQTLARIWTPTTYSPTLSCHTKSLLARLRSQTSGGDKTDTHTRQLTLESVYACSFQLQAVYCR